MRIFYRTSESGRRKKDNLPNATKQHCLLNALICFPDTPFTIFADDVSDELWVWLSDLPAPIQLHRMNTGSEAKSMRELLNMAIKSENDNEIIYFLEDDYLHLEGAETAIKEAMEYADYVTLYLHPDKFISPEKGGNKFTYADNISELTRVIKTNNHFWITTNSTTCTFAVRVGTLKEDIQVWLDGTADLIGTRDFETFLKLKEKGRTLLMPLPTLATHCLKGYEAPLTGLDIPSWERV